MIKRWRRGEEPKDKEEIFRLKYECPTCKTINFPNLPPDSNAKVVGRWINERFVCTNCKYRKPTNRFKKYQKTR